MVCHIKVNILKMNNLYPAQKRTVTILSKILEKYSGAVLQGEEGVGKTVMAATIAQDYDKVLWVMPAKAIKGPKGVESKLEKYKVEFKINPNVDCISYHGFASLKKISASQLSKYDFFIFDECHNLRNYSASWTQRFIRLKRECLFLSGTPVINTPKDFIYVLRKCGLWKGMTTKQLYAKYFDAKPSNYGDFLEFGEFQNKESFNANMKKVVCNLEHKDIDPDMPDIKIKVQMVDGEFEKAEDITEETKTRLNNGLAKVHDSVKYILKYDVENGIDTSLVLCHFHETAKAVHEKLGGKIALNSKDVAKEFKNLAENGGILVTTTGLTSCNLDLNECDTVHIVESTYSFPLDRQSINRCRRVGKKNEVTAIYYTYPDENPVIKSFQRKDMLDQAHSKMGPSSLARLEKCPGSYWLPDTLEKQDYVEYAAHKGHIAHEIVEEYVNNPKAEICETLEPNVKACIKHLREARRGATKWGCEVKVNADHIHEELWGTCDFFAWNEKSESLVVIDFKNGNYKVNVEDNLQLQTYALMVSHTYGLKPLTITTGIHQKGKLKVCIHKESMLKSVEERLKKFVESINAAKKNPIEHLNKGECDFFCTARKYHEQIEKENEMSKKKKTKGKSKKMTRHNLTGKVMWKKKNKTSLNLLVAFDDVPESIIEEHGKKGKPGYEAANLDFATFKKKLEKGVLEKTDENKERAKKYGDGRSIFLSALLEHYEGETAVDKFDDVEIEFTVKVADGRNFYNIKELVVLGEDEEEADEEEESDEGDSSDDDEDSFA